MTRSLCIGLSVFLLSAAVVTAATATDQKPAPATPVARADKPAAPPTPVPASPYTKLEVHPPQVTLKGADDSGQLLVSGHLPTGRLKDLTQEVKYTVTDPKVAQVTSTGRVVPLGNGKTEIIATAGSQQVKLACAVSHVGENLPINFPDQIVPVFTKLGCNSGGCHGKSGGQNGFRLSLLGFEPELDYMTLVKESRGRRLFPAAPDHSLLLTKAVGTVPHGGGKKMDKDSEEYKTVRRWIAAGMPFGDAKDPVVTKISVTPEQRVLSRGSKQQFAVVAHYSDGHIEDITRKAQYESPESDIATVDVTGLVQAHQASGEAAVMIRYQGHVAVFRATVPLDVAIPKYDFPAQTFVDQFTLKKYQELGLVPASLCTDHEFIRRVMIDLCGTLPTPAEITAFVNDKDPQKRPKLVDKLLERPEYAYYFANKWADILKVKRVGDGRRAVGTFAFHDWLYEAISRDMPYDQFIRAVIAATGDEHSHPPSVWYKEITTPEMFVDDTAQIFLGLRLACANCHHHPFEKWSQDDYWGLAAFLGRVGRKQIPQRGGWANQPDPLQRIFVLSAGAVANKRTGKPAPPKALDMPPLDVPPGDDPRQLLVDWMVGPKNPFVARAIANRYWAHFFSRGIVEPLDDMRVTNPPTNPALLDALAADLVKNKYSLKQLVRAIVNSRTYQLSAVPNEFNKADKQNFARFYPRRVSAEVLLDGLRQVTDTPHAFAGLPTDANAPKRAIMLPDEGFTTYFLSVFGKPARTSACECERGGDANLAQVLHLLNSDEVHTMVNRASGRADLLAKDTTRDEKARVTELFLWCFSRPPNDTELTTALAHLAKFPPAQKKTGFENLLWALINTKEFVFND